MSNELAEMTLRFERNADGNILVGGTRVMLDNVLGAHSDGASPEEIVSRYPVLELSDVYAAITYYLHNRESVDEYLAERTELAERVRREVERRFPKADIRERLERRRRAKNA